MRRKITPKPEPRATAVRALSPAPRTSSLHASVLEQARRLGLFALVTIAPLGALAGSVSACGGAAPVRSNPYQVSPYDPAQPSALPPVQPIAPPAAPSAIAPVPDSQQTE